jgi:hypothetical protein
MEAHLHAQFFVHSFAQFVGVARSGLQLLEGRAARRALQAAGSSDVDFEVLGAEGFQDVACVAEVAFYGGRGFVGGD